MFFNQHHFILQKIVLSRQNVLSRYQIIQLYKGLFKIENDYEELQTKI